MMNRMSSGVAVSKDGRDRPATRVSSSALLPNSLKTICFSMFCLSKYKMHEMLHQPLFRECDKGVKVW